MSAPELRVGITCRDDAPALELCLGSLDRTLQGVDHELVVVDACSQDGSAELARAAGAKVRARRWTQSESINYLLTTSQARHTLILHSDVALLADDWYPRLAAELRGAVALVAPDDGGLGPHLRAPYGSGHPESSFMLWRTDAAHALRRRHPRELPRQLRAGLPPAPTLDLNNPHLTHRLVEELERRKLEWRALRVLASPQTERWYRHEVAPAASWDPSWASLEYGFGNFYALGTCVTHYHQWYSRHSELDPAALNDDRVPVRFLAESAARFRVDYRAGQLKLPILTR